LARPAAADRVAALVAGLAGSATDLVTVRPGPSGRRA
jgi:hypothetical protein